jgi:hypothetical protein
MEEVFIYILECNRVEITAKGDLNRLYNQVKGLFGMQQSAAYDKRVNGLLSGLEKIVNAIAEMRNNDSDAHGVGSGRIKVKEEEAQLVMNSAVSFCDYILSKYENKNQKELKVLGI